MNYRKRYIEALIANGEIAMLLCDEIERADKAASREKSAFIAGLEAGHRIGRLNDMIDHEQEWQQYRCKDPTDFRASS